ncbi:MAG: amino acid adenylation domain-containing protein [Candidatus Taylorbacteria bacterium]|nr:amino acid adenylation domain-containing protein [Candidatus Taylorbacteria bacterium]
MKTIISLFQKNVSKNPSKIALVFDGTEVLYSDLEQISNKCADILKKYVSKGDRIGICFSENPLDIIVSILAILKIGCIYVPLDPKNPIERMQYLLQASKPKIIIGDNNSPGIIKNYDRFFFINDFKNSSNNSSIREPTEIHENDIAYIIFTSGSTGMPKGVSVSHGNLVSAYFAWEKSYNLKEIKCHLQVVAYSFDVFSGDWIRCLCSGAKLVMCPESVSKNPEQLFNLVQDNRVECAEFLPVLLRGLFGYLSDKKQKLTTLKILICGSDKFFVSEYNNFINFLSPNTRLINSYGTSETTIDTSYFEFTKENTFLQNETIQVPIGKAFSGMEIVLLDNNLKKVEKGQAGEIFIGGSGVSLGYINAPELNKEKFVKINTEMYFRTGDYGKYLSTGDIEFLGRKDNQVKYRGKRISLAEIENVLVTHFSISDSAIILFENSDHEDLAAFVVSKDNSQESLKSTLKENISKYLPDYMLPDRYFFVDKLPTNLNGKVDKKILLNDLINKVYE